VSGPADGGDKPADQPPEPLDVPPTRKYEAPDASAAAAPSASTAPALTFPDDGAFAAGVRKLDNLLGAAEQALLFVLLSAVVLVAAAAALSDKLAHHQLGRWWHYIVRGGTFSIAMFGAVFASFQQRHLAMDLVSRRLSPRGRLVLAVLLELFTIGIACFVIQSGLHQREVVGGQESLDLVLFKITDKTIVSTMPLGAALIILHCLLHLSINVEYLVRGKLPPERARSGH